jgi:CheY-like chemotaxis protein
LATHLRRAGYPVAVAGTGETGLDLVSATIPDVILFDIHLPDIDGWEVIRRLRSDPRLRHIPVAVISVADEHVIAMASGAADYFVKPINHELLLAWLIRRSLIPPLTDDANAVLVIDDDRAVLTLLEHTLTKPGLRVAGAGNGMDGLRQARRRHFDLIICDHDA